jgi:protein-S-isoprenylcysteine O-methyltransferase Ste14
VIIVTETIPAYGLWNIVIVNSTFFIFFAFSFFKPKTKLDWRSLGVFSAFVVALFAEMYGFPLTIYLISGWLQNRFPQTDIFGHDSGHLWYTLFGLEGDPHTNPLHLVSNLLVLAGFIIIYKAWKVLHQAQQAGTLATTGPYKYVRHPQYAGFIIIMTGFLFMWPTILTLSMYPIMVIVYTRLARQEERLVRKEFGTNYDYYARKLPAFLPRFNRGPIRPISSNEK